MNAAAIGKRLAHLEHRLGIGAGLCSCPRCGREHARKLSLAEVRSLFRVAGGVMTEPPPATGQPGPFCRCPCCRDFEKVSRWLEGER